MKALIFKGQGDIELTEVSDPVIKEQSDAIVKITQAAICGTDLHLIRGTMSGVRKGTVLGHEGVGVIEEIGSEIKLFKKGDRVIIASTVGCGHCLYCKREQYAQCDRANPNGAEAGTVFFGGPLSAGGLDGMQAEKVRVPYADVTLVKVPDSLSDEQVILLSDILPTAYMGVEMAEVTPEHSVAVFGCGPVGQLVIASLKSVGVKNIFAIDSHPDRLKMAEDQGATPINFNKVDPVVELKKLTEKHGPDRVIDAVGVDAEQPQCCGIPFFKGLLNRSQFNEELKEVAPKTNPNDNNWYPGNAPSQVLQWLVQSVAKQGIISIIGVYPPSLDNFPIGVCMEKNLTLKIANCNHKKYIPHLLKMVEEGKFDLVPFITQHIKLDDIVDAYKQFDRRENGWIKVVITP